MTLVLIFMSSNSGHISKAKKCNTFSGGEILLRNSYFQALVLLMNQAVVLVLNSCISMCLEMENRKTNVSSL